MKHHNPEPKAHPGKIAKVIDLNAQRRRRGERQTNGDEHGRRRVYDLPLIGPNRISVDYFRAA